MSAEAGWWNVYSNRGRYTVEATDQTAAEQAVAGDLTPGEQLREGETSGPYATAEKAQDAA